MRKITILTAILLLVGALSAAGLAQNYAITNATIVTVTRGTIYNGTLVIEGENITAIGTSG